MMPVIFAVGGVIEFVVLGGSDSFPALALALLPSTVVACLLTLDLRTFSPGFLLLVFPLSVFAPTNPQSYDPASYLTSGTLLCLAVFLVFPLFRAVLPLDTADRRRWILQATRQDLEAAMAGRARHSAADTAYLNADRVLQLAALPQQAQDEGAEHAMAEGVAMGEMTLALMNLRAIRMAADRVLPGGAVPARGAGAGACGEGGPAPRRRGRPSAPGGGGGGRAGAGDRRGAGGARAAPAQLGGGAGRVGAPGLGPASRGPKHEHAMTGRHWTDIALGGVIVAPLLGQALLALLAFFVLRALLSRWDVRRAFANPNLVELCVFIIILAIIVSA